MRFKLRLLFWIWGACLSWGAFGQQTELSNLRDRVIAVQLPGQLLDSLTVVPNSLRIWNRSGQVLTPGSYRLDGRYLSWQSIPGDSVRVQYRVLPFSLEQTARLLDTNALERDTLGLVIGSYSPFQSNDPFGDSGKLNYSGSFSRGFSFGNRQDLVLNSSFNLQMAGELGDGIQVTAAITDENLPIQPEGNTQQLREFDRVFIRLQKNDYRLTAGDYELNRPPGYFVQYFRKLEGATFEGRTPIGQRGQLETQASVAIARGDFTRQQIIAIEGNQGPYRLNGDGQQRFLIILAGTERVFIDGVLLRRGRDADYVIDYNLGEITFTPRRLITKDSRIFIEYEFVNQRYLRSLYAVNTNYQLGNWSIYANIISQQDSRSATGDLELSPEQQRFLAEAGDMREGLLVSTIDTLEGPAEQRATYALIDTIVQCTTGPQSVQILRYTTNPEEGRFVATFSNVGPGQGDYVLAPELTANERVYRYIDPDSLTCASRGSFAPVVELRPPEQRQMGALGTKLDLPGGGQLRAELAYTREDLNRFSTLDSGDDLGWAGRFDFDRPFRLQRDSGGWHLETRIAYERVQAFFRPFSPYRSPEFLRDWNLANVFGQGTVEAADEDLYQAQLALVRPAWGRVGYQFGGFERADLYSGQRHGANLQFNQLGWSLRASSDWLSADTPTETSTLVRPRLNFAKRFPEWGNWQIRAEAESQRSERRDLEGSLVASSYFYERWGGGLASPEADWGQVALNFSQRLDYRPDSLAFRPLFRAADWSLRADRRLGANFRLNSTFTYRRLEALDTVEVVASQTPGETFLGRIDLNGQFWRGSIISNTTYEIGSGQEPRIEFTYLFVGPGQGQYIWLDSLYNNDGKIQPNEMEISPFPDIADYVRVSNLSNEFIRTDNVTLNQSVQWSPERIWRGKQGLRKWLAKFALQSSLTINRKTREASSVQAWNPLQLAIPDSALVTLSASQRHNLFFNRSNPRFDVQLEQTDIRRRNVLITGYENQEQLLHTLRLRYSPGLAANLRLAFTVGERASDSEFFNEKDFQFNLFRIEPQVQYQPGRSFRFGLQGRYAEEVNELATGMGERALSRELSVEANYQRWLQARLRFVNIGLRGEPNSPIGFALLNGLQPGRNWIWSATATQQIGRYLQVSINYEGRQTGTARTVHVGRAQVTAIF